MTEQITIKLNKEQFRPLLDKLQECSGNCMSQTDSDLVGKTLLFAFNVAVPKRKNQENKTIIEQLTEQKGKEKSDVIIQFLSDYSLFKKMTIEEYTEKKRNDDF